MQFGPGLKNASQHDMLSSLDSDRSVHLAPVMSSELLPSQREANGSVVAVNSLEERRTSFINCEMAEASTEVAGTLQERGSCPDGGNGGSGLHTLVNAHTSSKPGSTLESTAGTKAECSPVLWTEQSQPKVPLLDGCTKSLAASSVVAAHPSSQSPPNKRAQGRSDSRIGANPCQFTNKSTKTSSPHEADGSAPLPDDAALGTPSCRLLASGNQWLLQAAELVFGSSSVPPDVLTEEPAGERRPLILAALSAAIEAEKRLLHEATNRKLELESSRRQPNAADQQEWIYAYDLVRLLLARGASLRMPSEAGILPLEYTIKNHSLRVPHITCVSQ